MSMAMAIEWVPGVVLPYGRPGVVGTLDQNYITIYVPLEGIRPGWTLQ